MTKFYFDFKSEDYLEKYVRQLVDDGVTELFEKTNENFRTYHELVIKNYERNIIWQAPLAIDAAFDNKHDGYKFVGILYLKDNPEHIIRIYSPILESISIKDNHA